MPLSFIRNDLTQMKVDAIVNPSNPYLLPGHPKTVSGEIFQRAGYTELLEITDERSPIEPNSAVITPGLKLPAHHIIHVANPRWWGGEMGEIDALAQSYRSVLNLAAQHRLKSLALPLLSSGHYRFPKELALKIALQELQAFLLKHPMDIYLVVYDQATYELSKLIAAEVEDHLSVHTHSNTPKATEDVVDIEALLKQTHPTFSDTLYELILDKGLHEVSVYKNASLTRQHYHKMMKDRHYQPKASTVLALCLGVQATVEEATLLMNRAGYVFPQSQQDHVVHVCLMKRMYLLDEVNHLLQQHRLPLIGSVIK